MAPGAVGKDKQLKLDILDSVFGVTSEVGIRELPPQTLRQGYRDVMDVLVTLEFAQWSEKEGKKTLTIVKRNNGNGNGNGSKEHNNTVKKTSKEEPKELNFDDKEAKNPELGEGIKAGLKKYKKGRKETVAV